MKQTQKDLLNSSMSRKEFLRLVVLGGAAVLGVNNLLRIINPQDQQGLSSQLQSRNSHGFGSSRFGE